MSQFDPEDLHKLISLKSAAAILPGGRNGNPIHPATLFRWTKTGYAGVLLQYTKVGATRCTTKKWLQEFFESIESKENHQA